MVNWLAVEDGYVIEKKISDQEVYLRCETFGAPALIEALEIFIKQIGITLDKDSDV